MPVQRSNVALSDISNANQVIKTLCAQRRNCIFVDTWEFLIDQNGQIISNRFLEDGVHLSSEGYRFWISSLKQAIQTFPLNDSQSIPVPPGNESVAVIGAPKEPRAW